MSDVDKLDFARKYRPKNMGEYIGETVKRRIKGVFGGGNKPPSTILMKGSSGCGKTSAARLICKEYFCEDKVDGLACGVCDACMDIDYYITSGEQIEGIIEVDITSESTKSKLDAILSDAMKPVLGLPYKVLILDECHEADKGAQNRLLKIMEEPPEHLIFILCTTDPERLIPTLRGRCRVNIEVTKPSVEDMTSYLIPICKKEGITTSLEALKLLVKYKERIPRESLNLLEEIAMTNANQVTLDVVSKHIGSIGNDIYMDYFKACSQSQEHIIHFMGRLKDNDVNLKNFLNGLLKFMMDCMYLRYGTRLEDYPAEFISQVDKFFKTYTVDELDMLITILADAFKNANSPDNLEFLILATSSRIGKVSVYSKNLKREKKMAEIENRKSVKTYSENKQKEESSKQVANVRVDDNTLASIFGKKFVDISSDVTIEEDVNDDILDIEDNTEKVQTNEDLMKILLGEI